MYFAKKINNEEFLLSSFHNQGKDAPRRTFICVYKDGNNIPLNDAKKIGIEFPKEIFLRDGEYINDYNKNLAFCNEQDSKIKDYLCANGWEYIDMSNYYHDYTIPGPVKKVFKNFNTNRSEFMSEEEY